MIIERLVLLVQDQRGLLLPSCAYNRAQQLIARKEQRVGREKRNIDYGAPSRGHDDAANAGQSSDFPLTSRAKLRVQFDRRSGGAIDSQEGNSYGQSHWIDWAGLCHGHDHRKLLWREQHLRALPLEAPPSNFGPEFKAYESHNLDLHSITRDNVYHITNVMSALVVY
ncbi:hypothetical protein QAD02_022043 [Eretmocerus hayati]|uniref:Uncharacterized protein n=1 Tax=Eretmocerus hayati TaxID=131215 RepID=A0ACC2PSG1_9HYME|nr:hypothetical protein QAD02_022043 [Eretmocerus hayati]